jgi:hypothetical protein
MVSRLGRGGFGSLNRPRSDSTPVEGQGWRWQARGPSVELPDSLPNSCPDGSLTEWPPVRQNCPTMRRDARKPTPETVPNFVPHLGQKQ